MRIVLIDDEPLWVAADVCDVLKHKNAAMAILSLEDDEKGISKVYTLVGMPCLLPSIPAVVLNLSRYFYSEAQRNGVLTNLAPRYPVKRLSERSDNKGKQGMC